MVSVPQSEIGDNGEVKRLARAFRRALESHVSPDSSFGQREEALLAVGNAAMRQVLEEDLQRISDEFGEAVTVDEQRYKRHCVGTVVYHSLCGGLRVQRSTYRRCGVRNGPTIVALELAAGLMERLTPALASDVLQGYAKHDMRSHHEGLCSSARVPPSRSTLEQAARRLAKAAQTAVPHVEAAVRRAEKLPKGAAGVAIGLDRTTTPMEEPYSCDGKPKRRRKRTKPYVRRPPAPIEVNYRMAYVATFALVDEHGEALVTRSYAASPASGAAGIVERLMADVRWALGRKRDLSIGVVQDGAPELWNLLRPALEAEPKVDVWHEAVDIYHLHEHLAEALRCVEHSDVVRKAKLAQWAHDLAHRDSAIDVISNYLKRRLDGVAKSNRETYLRELVYLRNNNKRMRYVTMRVRSLPVGSGVTEGAAKSVIGNRAKGSGRRWHDDNLNAALNLRSIYCSDRLPRFWPHLSRRYTAPVQAAA